MIGNLFFVFQNGSGEVSECASTSSLGSNSSHSKAPGAQLSHTRMENHISNQQQSYSNQLQNDSIQVVIISLFYCCTPYLFFLGL